MSASSILSTTIWISVATLITVFVMVWLVRRHPPETMWLYPLVFALPTLVIGLLALQSGVPTLLIMGAITFCVALVTAVLSIRLRNRHDNRSKRIRGS